VQNLVEIGFPGAIYPINPRYQSVLGLPCYPGLADLPEVPEALYIGLNAPRAIETVREAARCGVRAVVVHAGGFAETGAAGAPRSKRSLPQRRATCCCVGRTALAS